MASEYRMTCDFCGKETKGWYEDATARKDLAQNNWDIRVDAMWLEGSDDTELLEMHKESEVHMEACHECAKRVSKAIKALRAGNIGDATV